MARRLTFAVPARARELAPTILRIGAGAVLAYHGWLKLDGGIEGVKGFIDSLGLPIPGVLAPLVTWFELLGGIALIVGLFVRLVSLGLAFEMLVTTFYVKTYKLDVGFIQMGGTGSEIDIMLLVAAIALIILGPGSPSADRILGIEPMPGAAR